MEPGHEDREYDAGDDLPERGRCASMEPGHEDREYAHVPQHVLHGAGLPQWSPVMKTGNTWRSTQRRSTGSSPQWSPVMKTGNTFSDQRRCLPYKDASMEPGHEDREYEPFAAGPDWEAWPQWSPVMKTGNTPGCVVMKNDAN